MNATNKSETAVSMYFFYNQIEPDKIDFGLTKRPRFFYGEIKYYNAVQKLNGVKYLNNPYRIRQKIADEIYCDMNLNLIIPSKMNFIKTENL